jgi:hypothetical protein
LSGLRISGRPHTPDDRWERAGPTARSPEGWIGEIEGIDLTLTLLRGKRDEAQRLTKRGTVDLGFPTIRRGPA